MVSIATFNVNSIKARLPNILEWLKSASPDVVCLQELKCEANAFPRMEIEDAGYNCLLVGQKTYNGVAILSKFKLTLEADKLPGNEGDDHARYIEALVELPEAAPKLPPHITPPAPKVMRVASIYVPNGGEPHSDKFVFKMSFYERLYTHVKQLLEYKEPLVLCADYNVAPEPLDVFNPKSVYGSTCFHPDEHIAYRKLMSLGLIDAYRSLLPHEPGFSWWDYRAGALQRNHGYRIDHLLLSPEAADYLTSVKVDTAPRHQEKASDHTPVIGEFAFS